MKDIIKVIMLPAVLSLCVSCAEKKVDDRFTTPKSTYTLWLDTSVRGDMAKNLECITKASQRFMDNQASLRDVFMERMISSAQIFKNYSITDEKIKDNRAVIVIREPKSGNAISIPLQLEEGEWKIDLIAMFGS